MMDFRIRTYSFASAIALLAGASPSWPQSGPQLSTCDAAPKAAACAAVRGDRAEGWAAQSRAGSDHRKDGQAVGW